MTAPWRAACWPPTRARRSKTTSRSRAARPSAALEIEAGSPTELELYLTNAKADLDNGESAFLSLTAEGWRVSAAGCKRGDGPPADVPMDCELEA